MLFESTLLGGLTGLLLVAAGLFMVFLYDARKKPAVPCVVLDDVSVSKVQAFSALRDLDNSQELNLAAARLTQAHLPTWTHQSAQDLIRR